LALRPFGHDATQVWVVGSRRSVVGQLVQLVEVVAHVLQLPLHGRHTPPLGATNEPTGHAATQLPPSSSGAPDPAGHDVQVASLAPTQVAQALLHGGQALPSE
jgi:hypothetical protein